jgi:hypothetical protein
MSDESRVFERVAEELERLSKLSRLEARGTLRIALREAGFLPKNVSPRSMIVVLGKTLPLQLGKRGVREGALICQKLEILVRETMGMESYDGDTPERVFARIGRASVPPPAPSRPPAPDVGRTPTGRLSAVPGPEKKPGA